MSGYTGKVTIKAFELGDTMVTEGILVYLHTDGTIKINATTTAPPLGILNAAGVAGDVRDVSLFGPIVLVRCGGTATIAKVAMATTIGEFIDATTDNQWVAGLFLETGADNATVEMMMLPHVTNDVSALGGS